MKLSRVRWPASLEGALMSCIKGLLLGVALGWVLSPFSARANPTGGQVVSGNAVISTSSANDMHIQQTSDKAIIQWQSYNVDKNQQVTYQQPSASAISLNRINPQNGASNIYGTITSNGRVWLINPAGIYFGPTAYVNVGGLLATTAGISNEDFLAGRFHFTQSPDWHGAVINDGYIKTTEAGIVALVGSGVVNNGLIEANLGTVVLAAGSEFTINFSGNDMISFTVDKEVIQRAQDQNGNSLNDGVTNTGSIIADGGKVMMNSRTASDVLDHTINMKGVAQAKSVGVKNGVIILDGGNGNVKVTGKIIASGKKANEKGGTVKVLGNIVELNNDSIVDVSSDLGGGEILIGGNAHGAGPEQNAQYTFVGAAVKLLADTLSVGDGGKVIVWADKNTFFNGTIFARGGEYGGNGGFVETSGKELLSIGEASVDASATLGKAGEWLLDPSNVTISSAATANGSFDAGSPNTYTTSANTAIANVSTINTSLNGGTSVTILTTPGGTQAGNITLSNDISKTSGGDATLTLTAVGSITLNADITSTTGLLNVTMTGSSLTVGSSSSSTINTNGGDFNVTLNNAVSIGSGGNTGTINVGSGKVSILANQDGAGSQGFTMVSGSSITSSSNAADAVTIAVNSAVGGTGAAALRDITTGSSGTLTVTTDTGGNTTGGNITLPSGTLSVGSLSMSTATAMTLTGAISASGTVNLSANTDGSGSQGFSMASGSSIATTNATASAVAINVNSAAGGTGTAALRGISTGSGGTITVKTDTGSNITGGDITMASGVLDVGTGTVHLTNPQISGTNIGTSGAPIQMIASALNATTGTSGIFVTNTGVNALDLVGVSTTGAFTLTSTSSSNITDSGTISIGGTTTINAGSGQNVTLDSASNNFATIAVGSANNVSLTDTNSIILAASTIAGTLDLNTSGAITQSGTLTIDGTTTIAAGASNNITLTTSTNDFATVAISSGNNVSLRDANILDIGLSNISGTLSLTASGVGGGITQSGAMTVSGNTTIVTSTSNDVILNNAANDFSTVAVTSGNNVSLSDTNSLIVGTSTVSGTLDLTTDGTITQSGTISVTGATTLSAGLSNDITLTTTANNFASLGVSSGNNVSIYDTSSIILNASNISTSLNVIAEGDLSQAGSLTVPSLTIKTLSNGGGDITLNTSVNEVNVVDFRARNAADSANASGIISYLDASGFDVAAANTTNTVTLTSGDGVTAGGDISQSGSMTGTTLTVKTLSNSGASITLGDSSNAFTTIDLRARNTNDTANAAGAISYGDTNGVVISGIDTDSTLSLTANSTISQSGALTVGGIATFIASAVNTDLSLASAANDFNSSLVFSTISGGTFRDIALQNISAVASVPTLPTGLRNLTLNFTNAPITLTATTLTGTLSVTANGDITQTGPLVVSGTSTFDSGSLNDVTLDDSANDFSTVILSNANNVILEDASALIFGLSTVNGSLEVTTGGNITQSAAITIGGASTFSSGSSNITLSNSSNDFNSVSVTSANNVNLRDTNAIDLGSSTISGTLTVTASNAVGGITQSGATTVSGTTTLIAGSNNITLANSSNNFSTVAITSGNDVTLADADSLQLGTSTVSGDLTVSIGGILTDSGNIIVSGINGITTTTIGGIILNSGSNQFANIDLTNSGGGTINLVTSIPLTVTGFSQSGTGTTTLNVNGLLTVPDGVSINSDNGTLSITATDLDLDTSGALNSGTANITITQNTTSGSIGLGDTAGTMSISGDELQRMTAANLTLTAPTDGQIIVDNITSSNSANISGTTTLSATAGTLGSITFQNNPSTFNALTANADNGITVGSGASISTLVGNLSLNGDSGGGVGGADSLNLYADLTAVGAMTLSASNGGIIMFAPISLSAAGITISSALDGAYNLVVDSGSNTSTFSGAIGSSTPLGSGVGAAITMNSTGTTTFSNTVATNSGLSSVGNVTFGESVTLGNGDTGSAFSGLVTLNDGTGFTLSGYDGLSFAGGLSTNGGSMIIDANDSAISIATLAMNSTLSLISHSAAINVTGAVSGAGEMLVLQDNTPASTGTVTFADTINLGGLTTYAQPYNIIMSGLTNSFTNSVTFNNTTTTTLGSGNNTFNFNGGLMVLTNALNLAATINTSGAVITLGSNSSNQITLNSTSELNSNGGNITINALLDGAQNLTMSAASGDILLNADVGGSTRLGQLIIESVHHLSNTGVLKVSSFTQSSGSGSTTFNASGLNATGAASIVANNLLGEINVSHLSIGLNTGNFSGTVGGLTAIPAIKTFTILNAIGPDRIFFDGFDIYTILGGQSITNNIVFPTDYEVYSAQLNPSLNSENMLDLQGFEQSIAGDCLTIAAQIQMCGNWNQ